ncbi:hypothetical protein ACN28E_22085 [Archangium lansingense]|uniref:hypothetical protein n=1 Tax=Archangium lansingense TaxID=2995310 RepID=UPI003B80F356
MPWQGVAGEERVEERGWAYRRRRPEGTVLYEAVKGNLATLLEEAREVGRGLPRYVERDFARYRVCLLEMKGFCAGSACGSWAPRQPPSPPALLPPATPKRAPVLPML